MSFASPEYAWLFLLLLPLTWLAVRAKAKKQKELRQFAELHLAKRYMTSATSLYSAARTVLLVLAFSCLVLALMRPQWGIIAEDRISSGLDIVIALDLSRSMLANDLTPSRLAVAKRAIGQLLDQLTGDRVGIIAFAGSAFLLCPVTSDYTIVRRILSELGPESLPIGGSSLSSPLAEARRAFRNSQSGSKILMLLSDGEDHAGGIILELERLRSEGVVVFGAAVGTKEGGLIPLSDGGFVKDRKGAVVKSRSSLKTIRAIDPGAVLLGVDGSGLLPLLERGRSAGRESRHTEQRMRLDERYQIPLAAALLLLLLGWALPQRRVS